MDWIGNNLYWTNDGYRKTISVARLENASQTRKTLLEGNMSHPRAIVVDPLNRWEEQAQAERQAVDCRRFLKYDVIVLYRKTKQ